MTPLGPFGRARRVAVAVSGGADSTALALLAASWGRPFALIVDHGLRPGSADDAALTLSRLAARGLAGQVLTLAGLHPGPGLQARARGMRYAALEQACRDAGMVDLLLGHHAADQAETIVMRREMGSGPAGLAGMSAIRTLGAVRLLRPLLGINPGRLRATLQAKRMEWVEDPSNLDPRFARGRMRTGPAGPEPAGPPAPVPDDDWLAGATMLPTGVVHLTGARPDPAALAASIWTVSGRPHPPGLAAVARAADGAPSVLHGIRIVPGQGGWFVFREEAAMQAPIAAHPGAVWDGRFRIDSCGLVNATIGALGHDAARVRRWSNLPAAVLSTLPAIRQNDALSAVPHLAYPSPMACAAVRLALRPAHPLAGSPYVPARDDTGMNMPPRHPMSVPAGHGWADPPGCPGPDRPRTRS